MSTTKQFAIGKQLILGLWNPISQEMYDGVCSFAIAVWGQGGYGCIYEAIKMEVVDGVKMYHLECPVAVYREIVDLFK